LINKSGPARFKLVAMKMAHTMIRVRDLDATIQFYTEFLGLKEVRRGTIGDEATLVFLCDSSESYAIELTYNHDGRDYELGNQFGHLAFTVPDLAAVIADVQKRGWWYRENPGRYIFVKDPNGYDIEILQAKGYDPTPEFESTQK
jgi:lactoylglutathione lyase